MTLAETDRLIIRDWTIDDIAGYSQIVSDPEVMKFIGKGKTQTYQEAKTYIKNCIKSMVQKGWTRFAIEIKETNELVGFCGFAYYNNELDFGWRYAKRFWNKGYATEAAQAVLDLGIKKFKFPRIVCIAYSENKASIRIIEKIGMEFEKNITLNNREVIQYVKLNDKAT
ncbi:MAG: GNAT family N-acetyltransferase [Ignavibacteria bacterium]|nr:GNAT family N-acetyltransferase [Ignavibacteria bacterium]